MTSGWVLTKLPAGVFHKIVVIDGWFNTGPLLPKAWNSRMIHLNSSQVGQPGYGAADVNAPRRTVCSENVPPHSGIRRIR